jgi:hypothetical protein
MNTRRPLLLFPCSLFLLFALLFLAACSPSVELLALVTEAYITAVADKDADRLAAASCGAWEPQARHELEAFAGAETRAEGLSCSVLSLADGAAAVTCRGAIVAAHEDADRYFPLSGRVFRLEEEAGMWRVCGADAVRPGVWGAGRGVGG